ncbi:MAG TPA: hypothetical protein VGO65_00715 [Pseudolysinimonas sp.]|nr:hypothetical protein [Pseudolysinimonas sp.]
MGFLPMLPDDELSPDAAAAAEHQLDEHGGRITNMKRTLLAHVPSFEVYMEWYRLRNELQPYIGERAVSLFSYAISDANDCLVCSVYFRRILIESGDDPDNPTVTETEQLLLEWGRLIATSPTQIPDEFYARLEAAFSPTLRVLLVAFAGQMVATNLVNSVGRVPLDEVLYEFRKPGDTRVV